MAVAGGWHVCSRLCITMTCCRACNEATWPWLQGIKGNTTTQAGAAACQFKPPESTRCMRVCRMGMRWDGS